MSTLSVSERVPSFGGQILEPTHQMYDEVRRVHNGLVDKRPALIARCTGAADVADAIGLARALSLEVAVRGGGHNVAGRATIDAGIMIDLSLMKGLFVDPQARTVRAQGGVLWRELNRETQAHGLATTGGVVSSTGVAGLTLGGGLGWLMTKHGLALDNLRSVELVLADGRIVHASRSEHPDLFWAVRGGGGNFGIAVSLEYDLHPIGPIITGGAIAFPLNQAPDVLRLFRDTAGTATDDMMLAAALQSAPDGSGAKMIGLVAAHFGDLAAGAAAVAPLKRFGSPAMDALGPIPYSAHNSMIDGAFPKGALNYWKSQFVRDLNDDCVRTLVEHFSACPSPMSMIVIEDFHGAVSRVGITDTACPMRVTGFNIVIISQWMDPRETERNIQWTRDIFAALRPFLGTTRYVNYLDADEPGDPAAEAYGPNYSRLRTIKATYDPDNLFHTNVNIKPA